MFASVAQTKPVVGLFKDGRSGELAGIRKTLETEGFDTRELNKKDVQKRSSLDGLDVLYLPGGWNAPDFLGHLGRHNLVDFVANGGGVFAGMFRSGYVRTCNRPLFPEVGAAENRIAGMWLFPQGDSPLVAGFDHPFCPDIGWDHMALRLGPQGRVFMTDADGSPAGAYGEVYGGRYIAYGSWLGGGTNEFRGLERTIFLNCIRWLADGAPLPEAERARLRADAELAFLRQDKLYDLLLDERGPDDGPGILPMVRNHIEIPLFSRRERLDSAAKFLAAADARPLRALQARLDLALARLEHRYAELAAEWANRICGMPRAELIRENPFLDPEGVLARAKELGIAAECQAELRELLETSRKYPTKSATPLKSGTLLNGAGRMTEPTKKVVALLYGEQLRMELFPKAASDALTEADTLLAVLAPAVAKARATAFQAERESDQARLPRLIEDCGGADARQRAEAVRELGRIGDARATPALLKALDDRDIEIRVRAIQSLAWLQAREAVPELTALLKDDSLRLRRRAAQALGQIGDERAALPLLECLKDEDFHLSVNAILALGWLGVKEAVPTLIGLLESGDPQDPDTRGRMLAAMRALAAIGDTRAAPALERWAATAKDFPLARQGSARIVNLCSTSQSLGLQGHAEIALKAIKEGCQNAPGIIQTAELVRSDRFHALDRNVNLLIGRPFIVIQSNFAEEPEAIFDYFRRAGVTGVHAAWGEQSSDPDRHQALIRKAGEYDMKWIEPLPLDNNLFGSRAFYPRQRLGATAEKAGCDVVLAAMRELPAFAGFWSEEIYPDVPIPSAAFEKFLRAKFGPDFRATVGLAADEPAPDTTDIPERPQPYATTDKPDQLRQRPRLYAEYLCAAGQILLDEWREDQEWLQGLRKGCALTFNQSVGNRFKYIGVFGGAGGVIGAHGPETYNSFGRENAFMMELAKDGEARPVMGEFYNWYCPSNEHAERGFAQHLMHGECFFNFSFNQIFKQSNPCVMWSWEAGRWDRLSQVFNKAAKVKPYLAGAASAATVALVASERTHLLLYAQRFGETQALPRRYYQNQRALWVALQQAHTAADAIWAETLTAEKAARYTVLVLSDAKSMTTAEIGVLRGWVKAGGILIAGGATTLFNEWGEKQTDYALADVFGVHYAGHVAPVGAENCDTLCWDHGRTLALSLNEGLDPERFCRHVHRETKPVKSIGLFAVPGRESLLPGLPVAGLACEYDLPLGRDRLQPGPAKVLAAWPDGSPALTFSRFGQGGCYFLSAIYPGLCHTATGWETEPNFFDFWPGMRELIGAMVQGGMAARQTTLVAEPLNCPKDVEITVRKTADGKSLVVHLLNYDPNLSRVHGTSLSVRPLASGPVRAFYPDTGETAPFTRLEDGRILLTVRDFKVHDMLVFQAGQPPAP